MKSFCDRFAWPATVLLVWMIAWWHLAAEWGADEQYRYGFGVPVLAAWMMWRRFPGPMKPGPVRLAWGCALVAALIFLTLGIALSQHDPLWRFTGAILQSAATLLSIVWLHRLGGWPLVHRQLFPLLFAALAVPWPMPVELWTIQHLAAAVTDVAVSVANIFGVAALQRGNTIQLAGCTVGVDDACSGIQSLQATLMAAFFLGEFFLLRVPRRLALIVAGAAISFVTNCARVLVLTLLAHSRGEKGALEWHDFIGGTATVCGLGLLLATALLLAREHSAPRPAPLVIAPARTPGGSAVLLIVMAIFLGTRAWFSRWENARAFFNGPAVWEISGAHLPAGWASEPIAPSKVAAQLIRFTKWESLKVRNAAGESAHIIHLGWDAAARTPAFVTNHTPSVCLPSAGWVQSAPPFLLTLKIRGVDLPCAAFPFARDGTRLLALQSLFADGRPELRLMDPSQIPGTFRRLATLWQAPLRQITEELLLYLPDPGELEAQKRSATDFLEAVLSSGR